MLSSAEVSLTTKWLGLTPALPTAGGDDIVAVLLQGFVLSSFDTIKHSCSP